MLEAVKFLHDNQWVHRDIRWPNIVRKFPLSANEYMLIDLEYAVPKKDEVYAGRTWEVVPGLSPHPDSNMLWEPVYDCWMIGQLVERLRGIEV